MFSGMHVIKEEKKERLTDLFN